MNKYFLLFGLIVLCFLVGLLLYLYSNIRQKQSNIISLGIPCIPKHTKYLNELINNINNQELLPYEIIISLSESTEDHGKQLENKLNKLSKVNVKIITSEKKQYAGENRNVCGKNCNTTIISFIDSDDLLCNNRIKLLEYIYNKYNYDVLFHNYSDNISKCSNNYQTINNKNVTKKQYENNNNTNKNDSVYLKNVHHGHLTIKSELLNKFPIDIDGYGEDTRYLHTLFENDLNVISLPDYYGTVYRMENSSWK